MLRSMRTTEGLVAILCVLLAPGHVSSTAATGQDVAGLYESFLIDRHAGLFGERHAQVVFNAWVAASWKGAKNWQMWF